MLYSSRESQSKHLTAHGAAALMATNTCSQNPALVSQPFHGGNGSLHCPRQSPEVAHPAQPLRVPTPKAKAIPSTAAVSTACAIPEHTAQPGHPRASLPRRSLQTFPFPFVSWFSCLLEDPGRACSVLLTVQLSPLPARC